MVPPDSMGVSPAPTYSGTLALIITYLYGTVTLYGSSFQTIPVHNYSIIEVLQPQSSRNSTGLDSSAFARHYLRNHYCFLFLQVLRCFSSPGWLYKHVFNMLSCLIRIPSDQRSCAPPRSISLLVASFVASKSLGIPCIPLFCFSFE